MDLYLMHESYYRGTVDEITDGDLLSGKPLILEHASGVVSHNRIVWCCG